MTNIVHVYSEARREQQQPTWDALHKLEDEHNFIIEHRLTSVDHPDDYWRVLMDYWGYGQLIVIEQDIVPTLAHIEQLLTCDYQDCTVPYTLAGNRWCLWESEFYDEGTAPVFYGSKGPTNLGDLQPSSMHFYDKLPEFVFGSGLGLVKFSNQTQLDVPLAEYGATNHAWNYIDTWISSYMQRRLNRKRHVHSHPVTHNHYES